MDVFRKTFRDEVGTTFKALHASVDSTWALYSVLQCLEISDHF